GALHHSTTEVDQPARAAACEHDGTAAGICCDAPWPDDAGGREDLGPKGVSQRVELREERRGICVPAATGKRAAAEVDRAARPSGDKDVPHRVDGEARGALRRCIAIDPDPEGVSGGVEFDQEDVRAACARDLTHAKISAACERTSDIDVTGRVGGDAP